MTENNQSSKPKFPSKEWFGVPKNRNMAIGIGCAVIIGIVIAILGIAGVFSGGGSNKQKHTVAYGNPVTIEGYQIAVDKSFTPITDGKLGLNTAGTGKTFVAVQVKFKTSVNSTSPYSSYGDIEVKLEYNGKLYDHDYTACTGLYSDYKHGDNVTLVDLVAGTQYNLPFAFEVPANEVDMSKAFFFVATKTDEYRFDLVGSDTITDILTLIPINDGSEYEVNSLPTTAEGKIDIPSTYEGKPVTSIAARAMQNCTEITEIVIPNSVTTIGAFAFDRCSKLAKVTIGTGVSTLESCVFQNCELLNNIVIPNGVTSIATSAFAGCTNLTNITISDSVESIAKNAFSDTGIYTNTTSKSVMYVDKWAVGIKTLGSISAIGNISVANGTVGIADNAFSGHSTLTAITIPSSVKYIGKEILADTSGLETITVVAGNSKYKSVGNCLIDTTNKTLIAGCKTSIIPTDGTVTSIGRYAFSGCKFTSIIIPSDVTSFGTFAFSNCSLLTDIYYTGTEAQWTAISKENSKIPTTATVHYDHVA